MWHGAAAPEEAGVLILPGRWVDVATEQQSKINIMGEYQMHCPKLYIWCTPSIPQWPFLRRWGRKPQKKEKKLHPRWCYFNFRLLKMIRSIKNRSIGKHQCKDTKAKNNGEITLKKVCFCSTVLADYARILFCADRNCDIGPLARCHRCWQAAITVADILLSKLTNVGDVDSRL